MKRVKIYSLFCPASGVTYLMPGESTGSVIKAIQAWKPGEYEYTGQTRELLIEETDFDGRPIGMLSMDGMVNPPLHPELGIEYASLNR